MPFLFSPKTIYPKVSKIPQRTINTIWGHLTWTIPSVRQASGIFRSQMIGAQSCFTNDDGHFILASNHHLEGLVYSWHHAASLPSEFHSSGIWSLALPELREIMTAWSAASNKKRSHCRNTMLSQWTHFCASVSPFTNVPLTVAGRWKWCLKLSF